MPQFPSRSASLMKISRTATRTNHLAKLVNHHAHAHRSQLGSLQAAFSKKLYPHTFLASIRFFCKRSQALGTLEYIVILSLARYPCDFLRALFVTRAVQGRGKCRDTAVASISCHIALAKAHSAALKTVNLCCHTAYRYFFIFGCYSLQFFFFFYRQKQIRKHRCRKNVN